MKKKDLLNIAPSPQYIEGIYNYCDRWCARCSLRTRCLNYAVTEKNSGELSVRDLLDNAFWERLKAMLQLTLDLFTDWAADQGLERERHLELAAAAEAEPGLPAGSENHELIQSAQEYSDRVAQWFEQEQALFEQRQAALNTIVELGVGGVEPLAEAEHINDAVEVIRWYQYQIYAKFRRALTPRDELAALAGAEAFQQAADGSVKVALICMDRSIDAWGRLHGYFPGHTDSILDLLLQLDRLRRKAEALFPHARSFIRPGFDTLGN